MLASIALLLYEYIVTFDLEIDLFWKQKITMASVLFGLNRYLPLAVAMLELPFPLPSSLTYTVSLIQRCRHFKTNVLV